LFEPRPVTPDLLCHKTVLGNLKQIFPSSSSLCISLTMAAQQQPLPFHFQFLAGAVAGK
jgi:hypothetical protein